MVMMDASRGGVARTTKIINPRNHHHRALSKDDGTLSTDVHVVVSSSSAEEDKDGQADDYAGRGEDCDARNNNNTSASSAAQQLNHRPHQHCAVVRARNNKITNQSQGLRGGGGAFDTSANQSVPPPPLALLAPPPHASITNSNNNNSIYHDNWNNNRSNKRLVVRGGVPGFGGSVQLGQSSYYAVCQQQQSAQSSIGYRRSHSETSHTTNNNNGSGSRRLLITSSSLRGIKSSNNFIGGRRYPASASAHTTTTTTTTNNTNAINNTAARRLEQAAITIGKVYATIKTRDLDPWGIPNSSSSSSSPKEEEGEEVHLRLSHSYHSRNMSSSLSSSIILGKTLKDEEHILASMVRSIKDKQQQNNNNNVYQQQQQVESGSMSEQQNDNIMNEEQQQQPQQQQQSETITSLTITAATTLIKENVSTTTTTAISMTPVSPPQSSSLLLVVEDEEAIIAHDNIDKDDNMETKNDNTMTNKEEEINTMTNFSEFDYHIDEENNVNTKKEENEEEEEVREVKHGELVRGEIDEEEESYLDVSLQLGVNMVSSFDVTNNNDDDDEEEEDDDDDDGERGGLQRAVALSINDDDDDESTIEEERTYSEAPYFHMVHGDRGGSNLLLFQQQRPTSLGLVEGHPLQTQYTTLYHHHDNSSPQVYPSLMDVNSVSSSFSLASLTMIPPTSLLPVETAASPSALLFYHPTPTSEEHNELMRGRQRRRTTTDTTDDEEVEIEDLFDGLHGTVNDEDEETRDESLTNTTWYPLAVLGPSSTSTFDVDNLDIPLQPPLHHRSDYVVDLDKIDEGGGSDGLSEFSPPISKEEGEKDTTTVDENNQPLKQFYDYRHWYYNEQYHHYDDKHFNSSSISGRGSSSNSIYSDMGSEIESTCSSITLSEAFAKSTDGSDGDSMSATSSLTEGEYYLNSSGGRVGSNVSAYSPHYASSSYTTPSMISTCSSVTLSRALGDDLDMHEHHDGGFYVATRLGDFVEDVPPLKPPSTIGQGLLEDNNNYCEDGYGVTAIRDVDEENDLVADNKNNEDEDEFFDFNNNKGESADILDDIMSDVGVANGYNDGSVAKVKVGGHHINIEMSSDILDLLPECGVPIPSVMAQAGVIRSTRLSTTTRQGGMLVPWHSTRSIRNYHGRKGPKNGGDGNSNRSLFSISSVHSFRG